MQEPAISNPLEEQISPEEIEEFFDANNIEGAVGDLDDTTIYTHPFFDKHYQEFCESVCATLNLGLTVEEFVEAVTAINSETHEARQVNPNRWEYFLEKVAEKYGHPEHFMQYTDHFAKIYRVVPEVRPHAVELIRNFQLGHRKYVTLTHGNMPWSYYKMAVTGLNQYIDDLVIADEDYPKCSADWLYACERNGLNPENTVMFGDNLKGDVIAAHDAGIRHTILLPADWKYYREGIPPKGTIVMPEHRLDLVIPALMNHLGWKRGK